MSFCENFASWKFGKETYFAAFDTGTSRIFKRIQAEKCEVIDEIDKVQNNLRKTMRNRAAFLTPGRRDSRNVLHEKRAVDISELNRLRSDISEVSRFCRNNVRR